MRKSVIFAVVTAFVVLTAIVFLIFPNGYKPYARLTGISWNAARTGVVSNMVRGEFLVLEIMKPIPTEFATLDINDKLVARVGYGGPSVNPRVNAIQGDGEEKFVYPHPYRLLGYLASSVSGKDVVIMYVGWKGVGGQLRVVAYLVPREVYESSTFPKRVDDYFNSPFARPLVPVTEINDKETCDQISGGDDGYCQWFFVHQGEIKAAGEQWVWDGYPPVSLAKYPLLIN